MRRMLLFLVTVFILFFANSCSLFNLVKKRSEEKEFISKTQVLKDAKSDSISKEITQMNKAINDNIKIPIQPINTDDKYFNQKCMKILDDILSKINVQKSSGGNNYKAYYDLEKRIFELQIQIAETQNKEVTTKTNNETTSAKSTEQTIIETSKTVIKILPWWAWLLLIWLTRKILLIPLISVFVPGVKQINSISDLFNPPS